MTRVDDTFIKEIIASEEDVTNLFAFTEPFSNPHDMDGVPLGLRRMHSLGLINPIIEIDVNQNRDHTSQQEDLTPLKCTLNETYIF